MNIRKELVEFLRTYSAALIVVSLCIIFTAAVTLVTMGVVNLIVEVVRVLLLGVTFK